MISIYNHKIDFQKSLTPDELSAIDKFLEYYKKQKVLVADNFRESYKLIPLDNPNIQFKDSKITKEYTFCRKIIHNRKVFIIELNLWKPCNEQKTKIMDFKILSDNEIHSMDEFNCQYYSKFAYLIEKTFTEKLIVSQLELYANKMYKQENLKNYIMLNAWDKIIDGINEDKSLENALFLTKEGFDKKDYVAEYTTILYQLINYRINNNLKEQDLNKLDNLIYKLRKTNLLKLILKDQCYQATQSSSSILIDPNISIGKTQQTTIYNSENGELYEENRELNKCLKKCN